MAVIWNLLRAIDGQSECWTFVSKKGTICEFPSQKIATVKMLSDKLGMTIGGVLNHLWHSSLRNAFSHSQYCIIANYMFFTKELSPISRKKSMGALRNEENPSVSDIEFLYAATDAFLASFNTEYEMAKVPFKKTQPLTPRE